MSGCDQSMSSYRDGDEKQEIAYVYYYNFDLDVINTSFGEFLKEECGW